MNLILQVRSDHVALQLLDCLRGFLKVSPQVDQRVSRPFGRSGQSRCALNLYVQSFAKYPYLRLDLVNELGHRLLVFRLGTSFDVELL